MRHWLVFGDDTGDPGADGSAHFGYALVAIPVERMPEFVRLRALFRTERKIFVESKPKKSKNVHISGGLADLHALSDLHEARVAVALIHKSAYRGYWLRQNGEIPANSNFLRTYLVRKALELAFDGTQCTDDSMELVLDRNGNGERQTRNFHKYLAGEYTEYGRFAIPAVTQVVYANSLYVEGLQAADLVARCARWATQGTLTAAIADCLSRFVRMQSVLGSRPVNLHDEAKTELEHRFER
jgi:hypothetical protein